MTLPDRRSRLMTEAVDVLAANDTGRFIKPGPRQYPGQWNWDAAFSVIGLTHVDPPRARDEIRALLAGQWSDGMVPHIVFHESGVEYFPGPEVWGRTAAMPAVATSGITQPPLLATAIARLQRHAPDRRFLGEVLEPIERWHLWFHRDRRRTGLVTILHPWESGMDNSPRFDLALSTVGPSPIAVTRRDRVHVAPDQRPTDEDYEAYLSILAGLRSVGYRPDPGQSPFAVGDVFLTAVLSRAEADLAFLWAAAGTSADIAAARSDELRRALALAWDGARGIFCDEGGDAVATTGGLLPSWADPPRYAGHLADCLANPSTFGPDPSHPWYPTSVAKDADRFDSGCYWRGPVWANTSWLAVETLFAGAQAQAAERLMASTLELVAANGFWEYYDPATGEGLGSDRFSWTAAVTIDFLSRR